MEDLLKIKTTSLMIIYLPQIMNLSKKSLTIYMENAYNILKDKNESFMWGNASVTPLFLHFKSITSLIEIL